MDNVKFNVNGRTKEQLLKTLELLVMTEYDHTQKVVAWRLDPKKGIVLYWFLSKEPGVNAFIVPASAGALTEMIWDWLQSESGKDFNITDEGDMDIQHDGSNALGFRVYVEDWGKINGESYTMGAIIPAYCWYGK